MKVQGPPSGDEGTPLPLIVPPEIAGSTAGVKNPWEMARHHKVGGVTRARARSEVL